MLQQQQAPSLPMYSSCRSVLPAEGGRGGGNCEIGSVPAGALELEATIEASLQTVTRAHMREEANTVIVLCTVILGVLMVFLPARQLGIEVA